MFLCCGMLFLAPVFIASAMYGAAKGLTPFVWTMVGQFLIVAVLMWLDLLDHPVPSNVSLLIPAGMLLTCPLVMGIGVRIARRSEQGSVAGKCANCGYDLRATPDRCPECGTAVRHTTSGSS